MSSIEQISMMSYVHWGTNYNPEAVICTASSATSQRPNAESNPNNQTPESLRRAGNEKDAGG